MYSACYVIWWKLHDTIGPAPFERLEQDEEFWVGFDEAFLTNDLQRDPDFSKQLYGHHFKSFPDPSRNTIERVDFLDEDNW